MLQYKDVFAPEVKHKRCFVMAGIKGYRIQVWALKAVEHTHPGAVAFQQIETMTTKAISSPSICCCMFCRAVATKDLDSNFPTQESCTNFT